MPAAPAIDKVVPYLPHRRFECLGCFERVRRRSGRLPCSSGMALVKGSRPAARFFLVDDAAFQKNHPSSRCSIGIRAAIAATIHQGGGAAFRAAAYQRKRVLTQTRDQADELRLPACTCFVEYRLQLNPSGLV